jgi:DNA polymerase IV (DinB-like DNA polymerase)
LTTRVILLVDLDYFYAQCEELRNPSLKDKPVVVCVYSGRTEESGAVSTSNYLARKYSVKSGMPIYLAKKKLENVDAAFLPVDDKLYEETSYKVMQFLSGYADEFEEVGIDEAYLDVTKRTNGSFKDAKDLANQIKSEMRSHLGLSCSIGVGPNKLIAKIAADEKKPDGLTVVEPSQIKEFMEPLLVGRLIGVGVRTVEKMHNMGICTISDLAKYDVQKLISEFGKTVGTYFHNASLGVDNEPVREKGEPESLSRISTLKEDTRELGIILEKTGELCLDLHNIITDKKSTFKSVSIIVIAKDLSLYSRSKTIENSTDSLETMKKIVQELLDKFLSENPIEIRRVGVKLSGLLEIGKNQKQITSFFGSSQE